MMRQSRKFYFSVEGDTGKWYLEWLGNSINTSTEATFNAKFDCKIEKDPLSRVKGMIVLDKTEIAIYSIVKVKTLIIYSNLRRLWNG